MKILVTTLALLSCIISSIAQLPGTQWAKNIGGSRGLSVQTDATGNVYTTGYFGGVGDFDPGPGTYYLTADGGDAYISKLDANGNFVWAVLIGGNSGTNRGVSILPDAAGNMYMVGYFSGTVDFDPGPATFNITSNGQYDICVLKLDANGNFIWAKAIGNTQSDLGYAACLDAIGNIYVTGVFQGIVDFDPGPAVFNMTGGSGVINKCFVWNLDGNGNFLKAFQITGSYTEGDAITVDAAGNIYFCGNYTETADLNPGAAVFNVTSSGAADAFVVKLDNAGNFLWGKSFGGIGTNNCRSVKVDASGNVYLSGEFPFTVDFDPGPAVFNVTTAGSTDAYILKLNANGDFVFVKTLGGTAADAARDIALDAAANIYVTGVFQATADFDPGPATFNLTAISNDIFICKFSSAGNFDWAFNIGGFTLDEGLSLHCSAAGNLFATGYFKEVVDFDPGPCTNFLNSANGDTYIANYGGGGCALPLVLKQFTAQQTALGNKLHWTTTQEINTAYFDIEWSKDGQQYTALARQQAAGNSSTLKNYTYLHANPVDGNNYYRLKMVDADVRFTYSSIIKMNSNFNSPAINIFPNPVKEMIRLNIISAANEKVLFNLYNNQGKWINSRYFNLQKGTNVFTWDVSSLAAGMYFINSANSRYVNTSFIKQ